VAQKRTCIVCGKEYTYCWKDCHDGSSDPEPWKNIYCSEDCRGIFNVCSKYASGDIDAKTAKRNLSKLKVPQLAKVKDSVHDTLAEIYRKANESIRVQKN